MVYMDSPAKAPSAEPYLFTDSKGVVYLSWIEQEDTLHHFKFSRLIDGRWSAPILMASGSTWFVNWADYPMMATDGADNIIAHVLDTSGEGMYAYDIKVFSSTDGGNHWNAPFILHDDGKPAEHGFVTLIPYGDKFFASWLDGRNTVMEDMEGMDHQEGHHSAMSLRAAIVDFSGSKIDEWQLDDRTCDCCQTTASITSNGPVVIYRDRSMDEVRDISIVRYVNGSWTEPLPVFQDHWKISGCPVNGPRSASIGNSLVVAWFSAAAGSGVVNVIYSNDGGDTFGNPIRVDEGKPNGRVDVEMLDDKNAIVSWMEDGDIKAVQVHQDGEKGIPITIYPSSDSRSSGFPQMTRSGNELIFAWTDEKNKMVSVATLTMGEPCRASANQTYKK